MDSKEIKAIIANTDIVGAWNELNLQVHYQPINFILELKGFTAIYEFSCSQYNGWSSIKNEYHEDTSLSYFQWLTSRLKAFLDQNKDVDRNRLKTSWDGFLGEYRNRTDIKVFTYDCAEAIFLRDIKAKNSSWVKGAYDFLIANSLNFNNPDSFIGAMLAYEFRLKEDSEIANRKEAEKRSLKILRNDFEKYLSTSEEQLINHLAAANKLTEERATEIESFKEEKKKLFEDWFKKSTDSFNVFNKESKRKILDLEKTYEEQLRLKKPAEYWKLRATTLKKEGWKSMNWMIGLVVFSAIALFVLLIATPDWMLSSFVKEPAKAIKWTVVLITFLSFLAYGIRILAKVSFSSFHLARDAEEREQLTYVYLALRKDANVEEKDRQLILQSLFSRADTGLLKEDSSPTMPGASGIFGKFTSQ